MRKVHVLQVNIEPTNVNELRLAIAAGRTNKDGWQMPKKAEAGDLAVWYASGRQKFIAWGWIEEPPKRVTTGHGPFRGRVADIQELDPPADRRQVLEESKVNGGHQGCQTVKDELTDAFLRSLGLLVAGQGVGSV